MPRRTSLLAAGLLAASPLALVGCRGDRAEKPPRQFFPDMDDAPKWKPQTGSPFFADGRSMRDRVPGTIAHGWSSLAANEAQPAYMQTARADLLREDQAFYQGKTGVDDFITTIPIPVDAALLSRGQERFNIYCSVCHGYLGDGQGQVAQRWMLVIPGFHDEKYKDPAQRTGKDGYLFSVVRNGVPKVDGTLSMPAYGHALNERDAWAIVAYIRALQSTREGTIDDVPEAERETLLRVRTNPLGANP